MASTSWRGHSQWAHCVGDLEDCLCPGVGWGNRVVGKSLPQWPAKAPGTGLWDGTLGLGAALLPSRWDEEAQACQLQGRLQGREQAGDTHPFMNFSLT